MKKGNFTWTEKGTRALEQLKHALTTASILSLPNFNKQFCIECDASGKGIGVVLP